MMNIRQHLQDVETEVVGPHEFIDEGAANPVGEDGTITVADTMIGGFASDGVGSDGGAGDWW